MSRGIDILLIYPGKKEEQPYYLPLGILSIAGYLRKHDIDVRIYDINTSHETLDEIIRRYSPRCVGISTISGPMLKHAVSIGRRIRKLDKKILIIWGGMHPTIYPELTLKNDYVDFVVIKEGEITVLEIIKSLDNPDRYKNIKGIGYKLNGKLMINSERSFIENLDILPMPAWDLVDAKQYYNKQFWGSKIFTLNTSRGCYFRCNYCQNQIVSKQKWRAMSAKRIVEHLICLKSTYNSDGIYFVDDDFNADQSRILEFLNILKIERISIKWHEISRVNHYQKTDIVKLRRWSGCRSVDFGVESGSERMLKFIQKGQTVEQIKKAFLNCQSVGIKANALFMIGLPTETKEDILQTVKLLDEIPYLFGICSIYKPYPGNKLFDFLQENNKFYLPDDLGQMGDFLSYNDTTYNFSEIPSKELLKIKRRFDRKNIINYLKINLRHRNFRLILEKIMAGRTQYI